MSLELHQRKAISYKLQMRNAEDKDSPHWRSTRLEKSPLLFSFYIADMPRPTEPVKRICYAGDITVCASGVKIPELEHKVNTYLTEMFRFLHKTDGGV